MNANFFVHGGNSILALTFIEQIKQYASIEFDQLFDIVIHRTFEDILHYVNNVQREPTIIAHVSSVPSIHRTKKSKLDRIWSIQRCSRIYLHNDNDVMSLHVSMPNESFVSRQRLSLHWKSSMNKCIDASPVIALLDEFRHYVIVGSHAGLIHAYQIDTGQLIWSYEAKDRIEASPTISRDGQFVLVGRYAVQIVSI
jgi:hypothetical protein